MYKRDSRIKECKNGVADVTNLYNMHKYTQVHKCLSYVGLAWKHQPLGYPCSPVWSKYVKHHSYNYNTLGI